MAEVIKYLLPSLVVLGACYFIIARFLKNEEDKRLHEVRKQNQKVAFPTRLRAYERCTLLLERITPENLIPRLLKNEMAVQQFQALLIQSIRDEYEHNLSQQIYVTDEAWSAIITAKESITKLVNLAASNVGPKAGAIGLSKHILEAYSNAKESPTDYAIAFLKQEVRSLI